MVLLLHEWLFWCKHENFSFFMANTYWNFCQVCFRYWLLCLNFIRFLSAFLRAVGMNVISIKLLKFIFWLIVYNTNAYSRFSMQISHLFMVKRIHVFTHKFTCWENVAVRFICYPKSIIGGYKYSCHLPAYIYLHYVIIFIRNMMKNCFKVD